ncbi:hypothetical protein TNCV_3018551 [Trichonephila clavipes]|nr:hypothetical protein TNCV_3018551 [Trichonephila clavipes]
MNAVSVLEHFSDHDSIHQKLKKNTASVRSYPNSAGDGYEISLVYADKPQTLDHLEDNIRRVIADIRPQMLEKVIENWTSRLEYIRSSRGSPMPEIIFKMRSPQNVFAIHRSIAIDVMPTRVLMYHKGGRTKGSRNPLQYFEQQVESIMDLLFLRYLRDEEATRRAQCGRQQTFP